MTHPHDVALLNDLVDDRLSPAAADDLRHRLADEPALAAAHAELLKMRAALAAMPAPVTVPADFLARVRARAGLPPSVPVAAAAAPPVATSPGVTGPGVTGPGVTGPVVTAPSTAVSSRAASGAATPGTTPEAARTGSDAGTGDDAGPDAARAPGRVLPFTRFAVPIAAALGIVLGGGIYLATRFDRGPGPTSSARVDPSAASDRGAAGDKRVGEPEGPARSRDDGTWNSGANSGASPVARDLASGNRASGEATPGAPVAGAVTGETPAPATAPPATAGTAGGGDAAVPRFRAPGGAVPEGLRRPSDVPGAPAAPTPSVAPPAPVAPPVAAPPPAGDAEGAPAATPRPTYGARGSRRGNPAKPGQPVPARLEAGFLRAEEGVDEVVVVRAASVDEARALLAVLTLRREGDGAAYRGLEVVGPADELAKATPSMGADAARQADGDAMGSFVAELTPAAYAALVAARDMPRAELHDADEEGTVRRGAPPPRLGAATEPKDRSAGAADAEPGTATKQAPTGATPPKADAPEDAAGREKGLAKGSETGTPKGAEPAPAGGAPRDAKAKGAPGAPSGTPPTTPAAPPAVAPRETPDAQPAGEDDSPADASAAVRRVRIVVLPR